MQLLRDDFTQSEFGYIRNTASESTHSSGGRRSGSSERFDRHSKDVADTAFRPDHTRSARIAF